MVPSTIKRSADFEADSAEVQGALSHESIRSHDLSEGRFDDARVRIGIIDWESGETAVLYRGAIGGITEEDGRFTAELASRKAELMIDPVPRTSPTCRARFCGPGCNLNPAVFTHEARLLAVDMDLNAVELDAAPPTSDLLGGELRWFDGPQAGTLMNIVDTDGTWLVLDRPLDEAVPIGSRAQVREGCDRTLDTCSTRFSNAINFQGEPFLPGNDLITRYPAPPE